MRTHAHEPVAPQAGSGAHIEEVERDLAQMNALLEAAIEKLLASFMAIHRGIASQQNLLRESAADHPEFAACCARVEGLRADIDRHVGEAIAGLQFQDMTSQIIRRMGEHLAGVRDDLGGCANAPAGSTRPLRRTVQQQHLECGDIELF
ncbi:MAG: chemotaxis protein [Pseudomonadota bacterium]